MTSLLKKYGVMLLVTFVFALPLPILADPIFSLENTLVAFILLLGISLISPTIAGLIVKESKVSYFVAFVSYLVLFSLYYFPNRTMLITEYMLYPMLGVISGYVSGGLSSYASSYLLTYKWKSLKISGRNLILGIISFLCFVGGYFIYVHFDATITYLDQHPSILTIVSIIATFSITLYGGHRYYGKRKSEH